MKIKKLLKINFKHYKYESFSSLFYIANILNEKIETFLQKYDINYSQYNVIRILKGSQPTPLTVKEIYFRMFRKHSNLPRLLQKLEEKSLIVKFDSPTDKRETLIKLTPHGYRFAQEVEANFDEIIYEIINLNKSESDELVALIDKLL
jgi:MarR family 2-MHQ and catechol resistance regulon transcriptional repressor